MEIIVKEVEFDTVNKLAKIFGIDSCIVLKHYLKEEYNDPEYGVLPYIIEEK